MGTLLRAASSDAPGTGAKKSWCFCPAACCLVDQHAAAFWLKYLATQTETPKTSALSQVANPGQVIAGLFMMIGSNTGNHRICIAHCSDDHEDIGHDDPAQHQTGTSASKRHLEGVGSLKGIAGQVTEHNL